MIKKYKCIKSYPGVEEGIIAVFVGDISEGYYLNSDGTIFRNKTDIENSPEYWAKYLFTTEDGVDIYEEENCFGLCIKSYSEHGNDYKVDNIYSHIGNNKKPDPNHWKTFSTKEYAKVYKKEFFEIKVEDDIVKSGDIVYGVRLDDYNTVLITADETLNRENYKWFKSKETRDKYTEYNIPQYSKNDMIDFGNYIRGIGETPFSTNILLLFNEIKSELDKL